MRWDDRHFHLQKEEGISSEPEVCRDAPQVLERPVTGGRGMEGPKSQGTACRCSWIRQVQGKTFRVNAPRKFSRRLLPGSYTTQHSRPTS